MDAIIKQYAAVPFDELSWCQKEGIMYQTDMRQSVPYDIEYYNKYVQMESTPIAKALNCGRVTLTEKYCNSLLDIGIGAGTFIKSFSGTAFGFDINPTAVAWLHANNIFCNPYKQMPDVSGLCFWDSLEHIPAPSELLTLMRNGQYAFVSIPIIADLTKIKQNKHYKPDEHYYYFTQEGLIRYMHDSGFDLIEVTDYETQAGRESILTFVFKKRV